MLSAWAAAGTAEGTEPDGVGQGAVGAGRVGPQGRGGGRSSEAVLMGAILTTPHWGSFQDAIRTLNTLQTNASYLEQVKRERGDPQAQLEAMRGFLERSGLKVRGGYPCPHPTTPHPGSGAATLGTGGCGGLTRWLTSGRSRTWIN